MESGKCAEAPKVPSSPQETSQIFLAAHWPLKNDRIQKILDELKAEKDAPSAGHDGASGRQKDTSVKSTNIIKGSKIFI